MIESVVTGEREVVVQLAERRGRILQALARRLERVLLLLVAKVKRDKLSGQVLKNRTGQLRQSIAKEPTVGVHVDGDLLTGRVGIFGGPTLGYGRAHEFGFSGTVTVPEHLRTIRQVFGRPITPREVLVSAHPRSLRLPERSFLRSALSEMAPDIRRELEAGLAEGVRA